MENWVERSILEVESRVRVTGENAPLITRCSNVNEMQPIRIRLSLHYVQLRYFVTQISLVLDKRISIIFKK